MMRVHVMPDPAQGRWLLLLQCHHLVLDHSSLELLIAEVGMHMAGRADSLPTPTPFRDFVAEARSEVAPEENDVFFRGMLQDVAEPTAPFGILDVRGDGSAYRGESGGASIRAVSASPRAGSPFRRGRFEPVSPGLGDGCGTDQFAR